MRPEPGFPRVDGATGDTACAAALPAGVGAVLFDFDGTLADTVPLIVASYRHALATEGNREPYDEATIRSWIGRALIETLEDARPGEGERLVGRYREHNLQHHDALIEVVPGAADLVAELQAGGVPVGVVSSKRADLVRQGMRVTALPDVDVVVGLLETTAHKPDPAPLLEGARRLGVEPERCAYVGDALVDVQAARAAGMAAVAVTWGAGDPEELRRVGADAVVDDIAALRDVLQPVIEG